MDTNKSFYVVAIFFVITAMLLTLTQINSSNNSNTVNSPTDSVTESESDSVTDTTPTKSELIDITGDEELSYEAVMRSPEVFKGETHMIQGGIKNITEQNGRYAIQFRSGGTWDGRGSFQYINRPFIVYADNRDVFETERQIFGAPHRNTQYKIGREPGARPLHVKIYGKFLGLREFQLEDRSYAKFPVMEAYLIDSEAPKEVELTVYSSNQPVGEMCIQDYCEQDVEEMTYTVQNHQLVNVTVRNDDLYQDRVRQVWLNTDQEELRRNARPIPK